MKPNTKFATSIPAFPVIDIGKAVSFYEEKFGFKSAHDNDNYAVLIRDEVELHLWSTRDRRWRWRSIFLFLQPVLSGAESFLAGTHSCRIQVSEIDQLYEELKATGVLHNPKTVVEKTEWGTKEFPTLDLHGNLITFFENSENQ